MWWKIRYAFYLWRMTGVPWWFCWDSAGAAYPEREDRDPLTAVEDEVSYWEPE